VTPRAATPAQTPVVTGRATQRQLAPTTVQRSTPTVQRSTVDTRRFDQNNDGRTWNNNRDRDNWRNDGFRGWSRYRYFNAPSYAYRNWDRNRYYSWNNHRYHWFNNSWVIITPSYDYDYVDSYDAPIIADNIVTSVQAELSRRGYDPGPVDGVIGSRTRDALAQFQSDRGLAITGRIDQPTLLALGLA
jgi:hypothetical protein